MDLEKLTNDELRALQARAGEVISSRQETRKKELWGNMVAAIKKYESEIGQIVFDGADYDYTWYDMDEPGRVMLGII